MIKIKLISRKPIFWAVATEGAVGTVAKGPAGQPRAKRWRLDGDKGAKFFHNRRAAFGYFEDGRKVVSKPVWVGGGRAGQRRIR